MSNGNLTLEQILKTNPSKDEKLNFIAQAVINQNLQIEKLTLSFKSYMEEQKEAHKNNQLICDKRYIRRSAAFTFFLCLLCFSVGSTGLNIYTLLQLIGYFK